MSGQAAGRPEWKTIQKHLPFTVATLNGIVLNKESEFPVPLSPSFFLKLIRERPDVVICNGFNFGTLMTFMYKLLFGGKYIIWSEATVQSEMTLSRLRIRLRKVLARHAAAFIDTGTQSRRYLESLIPPKSTIPFFRAYNCVEDNNFDPTAIRPDEIARFREKYAPRNILFVGRLNNSKNIPGLLEAYRQIVSKAPDTGLIIIGDGPLKQEIELFREKYGLRNIHIEGYVKNQEIIKYYALCDLFMLVSSLDRNPLVILEALHAGIPIVCSELAGNAVDFISPRQNGYIVDPANIGDIVAKSLEVLSWDEDKRRNASVFSHATVQKANYRDAAQAFIDAVKFVSGE